MFFASLLRPVRSDCKSKFWRGSMLLQDLLPCVLVKLPVNEARLIFCCCLSFFRGRLAIFNFLSSTTLNAHFSVSFVFFVLLRSFAGSLFSQVH